MSFNNGNEHDHEIKRLTEENNRLQHALSAIILNITATDKAGRLTTAVSIAKRGLGIDTENQSTEPETKTSTMNGDLSK